MRTSNPGFQSWSGGKYVSASLPPSFLAAARRRYTAPQMTFSPDSLPIDVVLAPLAEALTGHANVVLQAPPGAGKTTRVPLALLDAPWLTRRRLIMLEPRRLAARAAARYMAMLLGEEVGETVGYRVRLETKVGPRTRIEVVTEGILTRLLQDDPALEGVGIVIFDEFHERNLQADLALALCLETQGALREDLRILVMSATLEATGVARLLGDAPILASEGRSFPVRTQYLPPAGRMASSDWLAHVASAVKTALAEESGDVLVFLPGMGEIKRMASALEHQSDVLVEPLHGDLPQAAQDRVIRPLPGRRRVILSTSIAETSLTIEGVRVVVDSGYRREPRFDAVSGMTRLATVRISKAAAEQRRARAGRLGPGVCYRLWSRAEQEQLQDHARPEILEADLAPLALDLAAWGVADPGQLAWLDAPPLAAYAQARDLLMRLEAIDACGVLTSHGREMAKLAVHPRLAHMLLKSRVHNAGRLACELAALLSEREVTKGTRTADVRVRLDILQGEENAPGVDRGAVARVRQIAQLWGRLLNIDWRSGERASLSAGVLLAYAYPDRIGQRRAGSEPRYRLANGRGAFFPHYESIAAEEFIVAAELDGNAREARIFLAAEVTRGELEEHFAAQIQRVEFVVWDEREQGVHARRQSRLGEIILNDVPWPQPPADAVIAAVLQGTRRLGLGVLAWTKPLQQWRERVRFLHGLQSEYWPDVSDDALARTLDTWLGPFVTGVTRRSHFPSIDLHAALTSLLSWEQQRALDDLAPTHLAVPSGSRIPLDYSGEVPVLAVRLQEMFGARDTPRIAGGKVPVLLHLLSPAHRPVQVTRDLAGFWKNTYQDVKKDLKGRYPKHHWPDDPLQAQPTARVKPRAG